MSSVGSVGSVIAPALPRLYDHLQMAGGGRWGVPYDRDDLERRLAADEWLKFGEVVYLAQVPRTSLNRSLREGKVVIASRLTLGGGQRRFKPEDVRAFLAAVHSDGKPTE
jgi:hypothetical protein